MGRASEWGWDWIGFLFCNLVTDCDLSSCSSYSRAATFSDPSTGEASCSKDNVRHSYRHEAITSTPGFKM